MPFKSRSIGTLITVKIMFTIQSNISPNMYSANWSKETVANYFS